jgi:hypothetical protein
MEQNRLVNFACHHHMFGIRTAEVPDRFAKFPQRDRVKFMTDAGKFFIEQIGDTQPGDLVPLRTGRFGEGDWESTCTSQQSNVARFIKLRFEVAHE